MIDYLTATSRDVIARSIAMHPSLFIDAMHDSAQIHRDHARDMSGHSRAIALRMADAAEIVARHIAAEDIDAIMSEIRYHVPALGRALKLQCVPRSLWADIASR